MKHEEKINTPKVLITSFILAGIPLALILKQPDLSTTIVTALIFAALLFVAGLSYKIVVGVLAVSIPSAVILFTLLIQDKLPFIKSYQVTRVMAWLYPDVPGRCLPAAEFHHGNRFRSAVGKRAE